MIEPKPLIVVVHDNENTLAALQSLLTTWDYLVVPFRSIPRSLSFIGRNGPDLVVAQRPAENAEALAYLEQIKQLSSSTEGIFLPEIVLESDGGLRKEQAEEIRRIVERLLTIRVIPEFRKTETRAFKAASVQA
ncbi:MAG TPA: hypothetical protein VE981_14100 [Planctomycetota bacterium]|nr:hypothetical protein [Planctomycetota bacterium]